MKRSKSHIFVSFFSLLFFLPTLSANKLKLPKIDFSKEIVFGQSAFLSEGALQLYGELIRNAINARFNRINENGGITGTASRGDKILKLVSLDDAGEPEKTLRNINFFKKHNIDMFLGNTGTRSTLKILPMIQKKEIALFFPWGGDDRLRKPDLTNLVNGLGLIRPQLKTMVNHTIDTLGLKKIAIFHDDSTFGNANKNIIINELKNRNIRPISIASYNRFTLDIKSPAKTLTYTDPKVVFCLATSTPTVKLINNFFEAGHYGTKFIGIDSTMFVPNILHAKNIPFEYTSPMPDPKKSNLAIVKEFRQDMESLYPGDPINILSLSYYIHAAIVVDALKKIKGDITKEKLITQIESMKNYNLGGFIVNFDKNRRHAYEHKIRILGREKKS